MSSTPAHPSRDLRAAPVGATEGASAGPADTGPSGRLVAAADLAGRSWGEAWVWHHGPSNDTHCLSPAAGRLLQALQQRGAPDERTLRQACGIAEPEWSAALDALGRLGWVRRC